MDHGSVFEQISESKPEGRRIGRPKFKSIEAVKKDLWKMKVKKMAKEGKGQRRMGVRK
jgi:hypothetical protein